MALLLAGCHQALNHDRATGLICAILRRARPRVKVVVIHYTAEDFSSSLATLTDRDVSVHYLIPRQPPQRNGKGIIWQLVPEQDLAWHAGASFWRGATRINDTSVGIELVNNGYRRTPAGVTWQPFPPAQIRTWRRWYGI